MIWVATVHLLFQISVVACCSPLVDSGRSLASALSSPLRPVVACRRCPYASCARGCRSCASHAHGRHGPTLLAPSPAQSAPSPARPPPRDVRGQCSLPLVLLLLLPLVDTAVHSFCPHRRRPYRRWHVVDDACANLGIQIRNESIESWRYFM